MNWNQKMRRIGALALVAALALAGSAFAQNIRGNIYGSVVDTNGAALPGVTVTLTGGGAPQVQVTDAKGEFRFIGIEAGAYTLTSALEGFSTVESPVTVNARQNANIAFTLNSAVTEEITVVGGTPLLDERKTIQGAALSKAELESTPNARDPWSVLTSAPGVQTDRINVGGNESGQQSVFVAPASSSDDTTWSVDGVNITDMTSISSPSYFDFAAFEELQFNTGGVDVTLESSGVTVNIVTKRGTNEWRAQGRYLRTDGDWQSDPSPDLGAGQTTFIPNSIDLIEEYGADIGGPLVMDRLWAWAAYGKTEIANIVGGGQIDATTLENVNFKASAQIVPANTLNLQYSTNDKLKDGRGAGSTRAPETTTDQSGFEGDPTTVYKVEDTHIFNSNFYLTGSYSLVDGGFQLEPKGGRSTPVYVDSRGIYRGSYYYVNNDRDTTTYRLDGMSFFNTGELSHELKFGGSYRTAETKSATGYGGNQISYACNVFGCSEPFFLPNQTGIIVVREGNAAWESEFDAYWIQDTITTGNLTANVGLRYEAATGRNLASSVAAGQIGNRVFMPALDAPAFDPPGVEHEALMPRLGITYALGEERKTLLRAHYSQFAEQYLAGNHTRMSSAGGYSFMYGYFSDYNSNGFMDGDAETDSFYFLFARNFSTANPTNTRTPNVTDPDLDPQITHEFSVGVDHALAPNFVVTAQAMYRLKTDITEARPFLREAGVVRVAQPGDYIPESTVVDGRTLNYFRRRPGVSSAGGSFLTNGDREQEALSLTVGFDKRMSDRWMLRGHLAYTDWTWKVPNSYFDHVDPTNFGGGAGAAASGDRDGEVVAERSAGSGSKSGIYLNATWSGNVTGLFQVAPDQPWGFNIGAALNFREGYPAPTFYPVVGGDNATRNIQLDRTFDGARLDDVYTLDLRLEKRWDFDKVNLTVGADVFNVFNDNTVLSRQIDASTDDFGFTQESVSPRVARLGVTVGFN